jgi:hypothetical protein
MSNFVPKEERQLHETVLLHNGSLLRFFFDPEDEGFIFNGLHGFISFITTAVRTSNPTFVCMWFCHEIRVYSERYNQRYKTLHGVCVAVDILTNCIHTLREPG